MYTLRGKKYLPKDGNILNKKTRSLILLDSSILMHAIKGKKRHPVNIEAALMDVSEGCALGVLSTTIEELHLLKNKKGKTRLAADFALELIDKMQIKIITVDETLLDEAKKNAAKKNTLGLYDSILILMAIKLNASVATIDFNLLRKLRKKNITCYYLHGKKWIRVTGYQS